MNKNEFKIPESFRENVNRYSHGEGEAWLNKLPELLNEYVSKWKLTGCKPEEEFSVHYICYARSPIYGDVVIKAGFPHLEFFTGLEALQLYNGNNTCKLLESDREKGIMLLERIVPGTRLKDEPDFEVRIKTAVELVKKLPMKDYGQNGFPIYQEQLTKAFDRVRREDRAGKEFISLLRDAESFYIEIKTLNRPQVLLHGDLHHENILKDAAGNWKVIDPQGRIGEQCLEMGRFLLNEWNWFNGKGDPDHMKHCIDMFAAALGESQRTIAQSCFLDYALSTCWTLEDGGGPEEISDEVQQMKCLLKIISL